MPPASDLAFVNILAMADFEDKDIGAWQGLDHPAVSNAVLARAGKLPLQYGTGFRLPD